MSTPQSPSKGNGVSIADGLAVDSDPTPHTREPVSPLPAHDNSTSLPIKEIVSANPDTMPAGMYAPRGSHRDGPQHDYSSHRGYGSPRSGDKRNHRVDDRYRRRSRSRSKSPKRRDYGNRSDVRSPTRREESPSRRDVRERSDPRREFPTSRDTAGSTASSRRPSIQQDRTTTATSPSTANNDLVEPNLSNKSNVHPHPPKSPSSTMPLDPSTNTIADTAMQDIIDIMSTFSTLATKQVMLTIEQEAARKRVEQCKQDNKQLQSHFTGYPNLVEPTNAAFTKAEREFKAVEVKLQQVNEESATTVKHFVTKMMASKTETSKDPTATDDLKKQFNSLEEKCKILTSENEAIRRELEMLKNESANQRHSLTDQHKSQQQELKSHCDQLLKLDTGLAEVTGGMALLKEIPVDMSRIESHLSQADVELNSIRGTLAQQNMDGLTARNKAEQQEARLEECQEALKGLSHVINDPDNDSSIEKMLQVSAREIATKAGMSDLQNCQADLLAMKDVLSGQPIDNENLDKRIENLEKALENSIAESVSVSSLAVIEKRVASMTNDLKRIRSEMAEDKDMLSSQMTTTQENDANTLANLSRQLQQNQSSLQGQEATVGKFAEILQNLEKWLTVVQSDIENMKPQIQSQTQAQKADASASIPGDGSSSNEATRERMHQLEALVYHVKEAYENSLSQERERITGNRSSLTALEERVDRLLQDKTYEHLGERISAAVTQLQDNAGRQHQVDAILGDRVTRLESNFILIKDEVEGCVIATKSIDGRLNNINTQDMCTHILDQIAVLYPYVRNTDYGFQEAKVEREKLKVAIDALEKRLQQQQQLGRDSTGLDSRPASETRSDFESSASTLKTRVSALLENGTPGELKPQRGIRQEVDTLAIDFRKTTKSLRALITASQAEYRHGIEEIRRGIVQISGPRNIPVADSRSNQPVRPNQANGHTSNPALGNWNPSGSTLEYTDEPEVGDPEGSDNDY
ncbi:hypothetical protein BP6252_00114 [Coleophoma cylindrospora]|uniref:Uncharacterized protein n=1 Tax=Coleophoma cylindrospora TaxID=1849047 RepID=A0A3D8SP70_9HELO|nr:hypothetical protein BP6252_00114 [Coleophoma cylindrospora]